MFPKKWERPREDENNVSYFITDKDHINDESDSQWYGIGLHVSY